MTKLVQGFTDIMQPMNLAVNGSFRINQRGSFSSFESFSVGRYLVDAWSVQTQNNVDYAECMWGNNPLKGMTQLHIKGYGKKGQFIFISNPRITYDITRDLTIGAGTRNLTAACDISYVGGVPVTLNVAPSRVSSNGTRYIKDVTVSSMKTYATAVQCVENLLENMYGLPTIRIGLEQDGEFYFVLENFRQFSGLFKHPPQSQTPYDIDLLRCKRYYQTGDFDYALLLPIRDDGATQNVYYPRTTFEVEMAGVPSITFNGTFKVFTRDLAGSGTYFDDTANWVQSPTSITAKGFMKHMARSTRDASIKPFVEQQWDLHWTAEV